MVLAIDLGTTNCRSAVFDEALNAVSSASMEVPLMALSGTEVEQDAESWWRCALFTMRRALDGADRESVRAISVSSQGISLVPVDRGGAALSNAISWLDTRAEAEEEFLLERYGAHRLFDRTGRRASRVFTLPKLLWLMAKRPEIYEAAWKLMLPMDFVLHKLTGRAVTDHTMAAGTLMYDLQKRRWMDNMLSELGIDRGKLPEILDAGDAAGPILPTVARELGLSKDVVVAVGGQDQKCAALGAGIDSHVATVSLGTGACVTALLDHPTLDVQMRIPCCAAVLRGAWELEGLISTAASCYGWFRNNFAGDRSFSELDRLAADPDEPAAEKFFPYLSGGSSPHWGNPAGAFLGLALNTDVGRLARAVLEGVSFTIRENLEVMRELGVRAEGLRLFGGGAKSALWCQITADIANMPVETLQSAETAVAGAAMLAFRAADGAMPDPLRPATRFEPRPGHVARYDEEYLEYGERYERCFPP